MRFDIVLNKHESFQLVSDNQQIYYWFRGQEKKNTHTQTNNSAFGTFYVKRPLSLTLPISLLPLPLTSVSVGLGLVVNALDDARVDLLKSLFVGHLS